MDNTMSKHNEIFEQTMAELRLRYSREDNATAIPRDDMHLTWYRNIVEECARSVDHIQAWDTTLGDHIRSRMGTL